ncbi:cation:proton antiporter [Marinoscillum sp.]|uniref:cation:proton antiporter n=1 Tax=Marinoscillum sp. TaxID=2024838 RepID=UPI003BAB13F8
MHVFDIIALFIFLAGLFIFVNTYFLKLPSSIGLMIMAIVLSLILLIAGFIFPDLQLGVEELEEYDYAEVLYHVVLSFMLFAGALQIDFKKLSKERTPVLVLATTGVLISTFVIGTLVYYMLHWVGIELHYLYCLVFGALISPTDPIAVTKTIKKFNLDKELEVKIQGESLFNDGVAVVLALTLLDIAHAGEDHPLSVFETVYIIGADIGGGIFIGLMLGYLGYRLLKYVDNDAVEVEILITLAVVMVGSFLADFVHVSSKQAAVVMGLVIGNEGKGEYVTSAAGDYVFKFWNLMEESLAAMLFVLIGLEMLVIPWRFDYFAAGFFAVNIVLFGRWLSVFVPIKLMSVKRSFKPNTIPVLTWGALRGGLPIALSLSLTEFHGKDIIITMTYIVVVCSVLYQGLTVPLLMKSFGSKD